MVASTSSIYTLTNPENGQVFYVGCTSKPIEKRLQAGYPCDTFLLLKSKSIKPFIEVIDTCHPHEAKHLELYWIWQMKCWGFTLENKAFYPSYSNRVVIDGSDYHEYIKRIASRFKAIDPLLSDQDLVKAQAKFYFEVPTMRKYLRGSISNVPRAIKMLIYFEKLIAKRKQSISA